MTNGPVKIVDVGNPNRALTVVNEDDGGLEEGLS